MRVYLCLIVAIASLSVCGVSYAEYWPLGTPKITFDKALEMARARLKMEYDKNPGALSKVPPKEIIHPRSHNGT